jgi:hypothetical protein
MRHATRKRDKLRQPGYLAKSAVHENTNWRLGILIVLTIAGIAPSAYISGQANFIARDRRDRKNPVVEISSVMICGLGGNDRLSTNCSPKLSRISRAFATSKQ